jgi:hypothetical protein
VHEDEISGGRGKGRQEEGKEESGHRRRVYRPRPKDGDARGCGPRASKLNHGFPD